MSKTRERIEEARYFLNRVKETLPSPTTNFESSQFAFKCNLNAFISFARSVTSLPDTFSGKGMFVLENEFSNKKGFSDWRKGQVDKLKNDDLANFFAKKRNISVHHRSLQPQGVISSTFIETVPVFSFGFSVSTPVDATEDEVNEILTKVKQHEPSSSSIPVIQVPIINELTWYFHELPGGMTPENEVITVCEKYLAGLELLLSDWEEYQKTKG